jgi:hypothetical protein
MSKMRNALPVLAVMALATGGCSMLHAKGGTPDEFAVARNAPLVIPPDYTLAPPVAGTAGLTPEGAQAQAIEALFGGPAPRSTSESMLLEKAGRDRAMIGARSVAGDPDTRVVDTGQVTTTILAAPESNGQVASAQ